MKASDFGKTTRYECEINMLWAQENPELFVNAIDRFIEEAVQLDLYDVSMKIDRVHFIKLIAEPQKETSND